MLIAFKNIDTAPNFDPYKGMDDIDFLAQPMANFFARNAGTENDSTCPHRRYAENLDLADDGSEMYLRWWVERLAHSRGVTVESILTWNDCDKTATVFLDDEVYLLILPDMCEDLALRNHFNRTPMVLGANTSNDGDETSSINPGMPLLIRMIEIRNSRAVVALLTDHDIDLSMYDGYRFSNPDEAAIVFASRYNRPSIHLAREFGAVIFRVEISSGIFGRTVDTFYSYGSTSGIGRVDVGGVGTFENSYALEVHPSSLPNAPSNHRFFVVADIHTHGPLMYFKYTDPDGIKREEELRASGFSRSDIDVAKSRASRYFGTFRYVYVVDNCGTLFKATRNREWGDEHILLGGFYVCPLRKYQHQSGNALNLIDHPYHWLWNLIALPWNPDLELNDIGKMDGINILYYHIKNNLPPLQ